MDFDYMNMKDLNPVFDEYTPLLASSNAFLQEHPDQARAFLAATAKGYQYAMENPEDAAKILVKHAPEIDEAIAVESQKWLADQYQGDKPHWGTFDPVRWGNFDVGLVMLFAINEGDERMIKIFFDWVSNVVNRPEELAKIVSSCTYEEFIDRIMG